MRKDIKPDAPPLPKRVGSKDCVSFEDGDGANATTLVKLLHLMSRYPNNLCCHTAENVIRTPNTGLALRRILKSGVASCCGSPRLFSLTLLGKNLVRSKYSAEGVFLRFLAEARRLQLSGSADQSLDFGRFPPDAGSHILNSATGDQ